VPWLPVADSPLFTSPLMMNRCWRPCSMIGDPTATIQRCWHAGVSCEGACAVRNAAVRSIHGLCFASAARSTPNGTKIGVSGGRRD
jgi:hypothetical protein